MNPPRVLLVDDDVDSGQTLRLWIERQGWRVTFANGPQAADAALTQGTFDLVLSDIQMPGNCRLEWVERLFRGECPPPVVLMTGGPQLETAVRAANLPIAAYLLKPLDYAVLASTLSRLIAQQKRHLEFLAVAREISRLLGETGAGSPGADPALANRLDALARTFAAESIRDFRSPATSTDDAPWRLAIADTIAVLEKTKHSFRSRELGQLRHRLEQFLGDPASLRPPPALVAG